MPGWMHEILDLLVFGRSYPEIHKRKDAAWKELGIHHREEMHEWYSLYSHDWDFDNPFPKELETFLENVLKDFGPERAESDAVWVAHDYFDRLWDELSCEKRKECAAAFRTMILDTQFLKQWAGVDVVEGRIQRRLEGRIIGKMSQLSRHYTKDYVTMYIRRLSRSYCI